MVVDLVTSTIQTLSDLRLHRLVMACRSKVVCKVQAVLSPTNLGATRQ